jgi:hypothetical protein
LFLLFYIIETTAHYAAHMLWLMSGKAAIVHRNYLRTWLVKSSCKPRKVEDCEEIVAAAGLGFFDNASHHFVISFCGCAFERRIPLGEDVVFDPSS